MRARLFLALPVGFALVASLLVSMASSQDQTSWYVNDSPSLFGPSEFWWAGDAGKGYGSNNYVYTYGIAGASSADNWARWSMGSRVGRQEVEVYVPNTRATATVLYRIDIGGVEHTKRVAQRNAYGWTSLGRYDVDGASVSITLSDNDASQHWNRHGYGSSSIGVDAVRMRCVSRCSTAPTPTAVPRVEEPSAPRSVRASAAGAGGVDVSWSAPSDDGGEAVSGYRVDLYRGSSRLGRKSLSGSARSVSFSGLDADTAYQVRVSARNSAGYGDRATANVRTDAATQRQVVRSVSIGLGADRAGCGDSSKPCRWLSASYSGFSSGRYSAQCYWSASLGSLGTQFASFTANTGSGSDSTLCWFNGSPGRYLTAVVDGVRSNTIQFAGTASTPTSRPTAVPRAEEPSAPRNVTAVVRGDGSIRVTWDPPDDSGNSSISHYRIEYSRPAVGSSGPWSGRGTVTGTSHTKTNNRSGTTYHVKVIAVNGDGLTSAPATDTVTTNPPGPPTGPRNIKVELVDSTRDRDSLEEDLRISWAPPSDANGNPIIQYQYCLRRGPISRGPDKREEPWSGCGTTSQTQITFNALQCAIYDITVSARNRHGWGPEEQYTRSDAVFGLFGFGPRLNTGVFTSGSCDPVPRPTLSFETSHRKELGFVLELVPGFEATYEGFSDEESNSASALTSAGFNINLGDFGPIEIAVETLVGGLSGGLAALLLDGSVAGAVSLGKEYRWYDRSSALSIYNQIAGLPGTTWNAITQVDDHEIRKLITNKSIPSQDSTVSWYKADASATFDFGLGLTPNAEAGVELQAALGLEKFENGASALITRTGIGFSGELGLGIFGIDGVGEASLSPGTVLLREIFKSLADHFDYDLNTSDWSFDKIGLEGHLLLETKLTFDSQRSPKSMELEIILNFDKIDSSGTSVSEVSGKRSSTTTKFNVDLSHLNQQEKIENFAQLIDKLVDSAIGTRYFSKGTWMCTEIDLLWIWKASQCGSSSSVNKVEFKPRDSDTFVPWETGVEKWQ